MALSMRLERVYMYAKMGQDLDNASPKAQSMVDRATAALFRVQEATAFLTPELTAMDPAALLAMVEQDEELADYRHMVDEDVYKRQPCRWRRIWA